MVYVNALFLLLLRECTLPFSQNWAGWEIHSTDLSTNFVFFSVMPSSILALDGEYNSHGTSSSSLILQILYISNIVPGRVPLSPLPYISGSLRRERGKEGERRKYSVEKCFEVQNPAEAADLSIAAVTAATTIIVAATYFKNVCIKLGKINTLKISLKLFSADVFFVVVGSKTRNICLILFML